MTRLLLLAMLSACNGAEVSPPPTPEKMIVVGARADITTLHPLVASAVDERNIISNLAMPTYQFHFDCGLVAEPGLAKAWTWSEDGRSLRVELRDDITWADGQPVTARDVQFTYTLMANPALRNAYAAMLRNMNPDAMPRVIDDHTIEWGFTHAYDRTAQLAQTSAVLVPEHLLRDVPPESMASHSYALNPVSNGPWAFTDRSPGIGWMLRPNRAFTGPEEMRARLDRVEFRVLPDDNTLKLELINGRIDLLNGLGPRDAEQLRLQRSDLQIVARGQRRLEMLALNPAVPPLNDPEVRRGLAAALDIDRMFDTMQKDNTGRAWGRRAIGPISPEFCHAYNPGVVPIPTDPERARKALAAAGWRDTDNDGYVDRDGNKLRLSILFSAEFVQGRQIAEMAQTALAAVGIELVLDPAPRAISAERRKKKDYQIAYHSTDAALYLDPSAQWRSPDPQNPSLMNVTGYSNPAVDALIDAGLREPDPVQANAYWHELQRIVHDDQPVIFLWWSADLVALSSRITGHTIDLISPLHDLHRWDIAPGG